MKMKWLCAGLLLVTVQTQATLASVKSIGMAAACVANPQDSMIIAYNPAGITETGNRIDVGLTGVYTDAQSIVSGNVAPVPGINGTYKNRARYKPSPEFGITYQPLSWLNVGLAVFNEKEVHVSNTRPIPLLGTSKTGLEYEQMIMAPTVAVKIGRCNSLGISLDWIVQRTKIKGLQNIAHPVFAMFQFSKYPDNVTNNGYDYSQGIGVSFGWMGEFYDWLSIGAYYKPKTKMSRFKKYKGFLAEAGRLDIPEMARLGVAIYPFCGWTFAIDGQFIHYEKTASLNNDFDPNIFIDLLGDDNGAAFGWGNQYFVRVGVNWDINCEWSVRAGYRHANVPFSGKNVAPNLLTQDTAVDFLTIGATYRFTSWGGEVSAFAAHGFNRKVSGPLPANPPFFGGDLSVEQSRSAIGVSLGLCY